MTILPILLSLCSLFAFTQSAPAQTTMPAQSPSAAPVVTVTITPAGVRFVALGPVSQTRLEVYDAAGEPVSDTGFRPGNVRDFSPRAAGLADGSHSCVLTARGLDGRISLRQGSVLVRSGEAALELGVDAEGNSAAGQSSTVPGGLLNTAAGIFSFAAGQRAKANHQGAFVWADSTNADFASTANNQFHIRAGGGVGIGTNAPATPLHVEGAHIYLGTAGTGVILKSTNGNVCRRLWIDDTGTLQITGGFTCP